MVLVSPQQTGGGPFATALRDALAEHGIPLERVQCRLAERGHSVSLATLSYWCNGRSLPTRKKSLEIVQAMESILGLDEGSLVATLASRPITDIAEVLGGPSATVADLAREHGMADSSAWAHTFVHHTVTLGPDRVERAMDTTFVQRCESSGADAWTIIIDDSEGRSLELGPCTGVTERRRLATDDGLLLVELALPQPLRRGASAMTRHGLVFGPGGDTTRETGYAVTRDVGLFVLEVVFECDPPSRIEYVLRPPGADDVEVGSQPLVVAPSRAHVALSSPARGLHQLRWAW